MLSVWYRDQSMQAESCNESKSLSPHPSPELEDKNVMMAELMEKLPRYVAKCLKVAGYDDAETIADMDISEGPSNTIQIIEEYIEKRYHDNVEYCGCQASSTLPFEFPPGHRVRIRKFVENVRKLVCKQSVGLKIRSKRKHPSAYRADKRAKQMDTTSTCSDNDSECEDSITANIRSNIVKWIKAQKPTRLRNLRENKHYSIVVKCIAETTNFSVQVTCLGCKKSLSLQRKGSSNRCSPYIISNWTRHIKKCDKSQQESSHQLSLFSHGFATTPIHRSSSKSRCKSSSDSDDTPLSILSSSVQDSQSISHDTIPSSANTEEENSKVSEAEVIETLAIEDIADQTVTTESDSVFETSQVFQPPPPSLL